MPPNLIKKKQSDDRRRPNIWRYISSKRFGRRERRDSSADEDEARPGLPGALFDDSDRSDSILINEDVEEVDSVCSEYSDAHSTWQDPLTKSEHVTPLAADKEQNDPSRVLFHYGSPSNSNTPAASAARGDTCNSVTSSHVPHLDIAVPRHATQSLCSPGPIKLGRSNEDNSVRPGGWARGSGDLVNPLQSRLDKGKDVEYRPDWSTAVNPWAMLDISSVETDERDNLVEENARLRAELENLKATISMGEDTILNREEPISPRKVAAEVRSPSRAQRSRQKKRQDAIFFETTTLRDLVLKRLFTPHVLVDGIRHDEDLPVTLDTPLTSTQVHDFTRIMNEVIMSGRNLKQPIALCAVCHLPKFKGARGLNQNSYVSEVLAQLPTVSASAFQDFDPVWGTSRCCRRYVCKTCLGNAILAGISIQWWFDLSNHGANWLKCPVPCCGRSLPLYSNDDVLSVLDMLGMREGPSCVDRLERANQLRLKLQTLDPLPSKEEVRRSKVLHDRLARYKRMLPLLDHVPEASHEGAITLESLPVDTADGRGTLKIPLFTHLLRPRVPRTCMVCDEIYREFDRGNPQGWKRASRGFDGEWTWRILFFPTPEILPHCHHVHDICRSCLGRYIAAQLETRGHSVVDNISCPVLDCDHKFTHGEIRHLATPESFASYDRYTVLNSVSSLPNFRWCLREDCTSGGLYDDPSSTPSTSWANANCIECSECSFTMCFSCQSPWHAGLTCTQYASQREESFTETRNWLAQNTKPCPGQGCGVQVQKGDGCFHMTCSRCRFEFCWECLADWRRIFVPDNEGGFLRADGHREGCFFRNQAAPLPTQVMGQDLAIGLRRLERGPAAAAVPG